MDTYDYLKNQNHELFEKQSQYLAICNELKSENAFVEKDLMKYKDVYKLD